MDNIILNEDQLWQLRNFIIKRGIKEADVVNEILDHFACKVEEILSAEKNLPFERAMQLAHQSFGASGFRPLVAEYEKQVEKVMWIDYKSTLKETVVSPQLFISICAAMAFYNIINNIPELWKSHWLFGVKYWALLFNILVFFSTKIYYTSKLKRHFNINILKAKSLQYWQQISFSNPGNALMAANFALIVTPSTEKEPSMILLVYCYLIIALSTISSLAQYKTFLKMNNRFGEKLMFN